MKIIFKYVILLKERFEMFIQLSKEGYNTLSESEKVIIDYINEHVDTLMDTSITTIARKTFTSPATVSRAIRKCGYQSMSDLRYSYVEQQEQRKTSNSSHILNESLAKSYRETAQTIDQLDTSKIMQTIEYIQSAKRIFIVSRGFTTLVADELQMYLQLFGYTTIIVKDVMWMKKIDRIVEKEDTVIFLSVNNSTPELFEAAQAVKTVGAKIVTCCCKEKTNLEEIADVALIGHSEPITEAKGLTISSRIPLFVITRTIIEYLAQ